MSHASLESLIQRALKYQKQGNYSRACTVYNGLIRRGHRTARLLTNLGAAIYEAGQTDAGLEAFQAALSLDPTYKDAWNNLCLDAARRDNWNFALAISEQTLAADPRIKPARSVKAQALMAVGSFSAAQELLAELLAECPDDLKLREFMARCHLASADLDSAVAHLLYILSLKPGDAFASIELAEIAAKGGDPQSSMAILLSAHAINPEDIHIILKIAREYQLLGRMHEALAMYDLASSIMPESPEIMAVRAYCLSEIGEIDRFYEIYDELSKRCPLSPEMLVSAIFVSSTQGEAALTRLRDYSDQYWKFFEPSRSCSAMASSQPPVVVCSSAARSALRFEEQRKRIGIVTGGLGSHVESCFLGSFLLNYSKDQFHVEVVSSRWLNDDISAVLSRAVDQCHSISDLSLRAARDLICRQNYDVIIETTGFTSGSAIHVLADRCAPVQCHWIGYHASTFMPTMDYFIGDSVLMPEDHSERFSEQIVRLNRAWLAATPFAAIPEARPPANDEVTLGCFSQVAKLTKKTLSLWAQLLLAAPQCTLLFKDRFTVDSQMVDRIRAFFSSQGVDSQRLVFMPRSQDWIRHMAMYNLVDISLDTTPWSSATTAFDALAMGVPMISIKGGTTSGLMSTSVLHHAGKGSWVAGSEAEYLEKNLALIDDIATHRQARRELQGQVLTSQLFDGKDVTRAVEDFLCGL